MGVSIDIHIYNIGELLDEIETYVKKEGGYREGALPVRQWFTRVAPKFGVVEGDKFFLLWNEYYEEYNAATAFLNAVDRYYFPDRTEDNAPEDKGYWDTFFAHGYGYGVSGATTDEVLSELFPEEFGYEGKFGYE